MNGLWNALTQVEEEIKGKENLLPFVTPLSIQELIEHRAAAEYYWKF